MPRRVKVAPGAVSLSLLSHPGTDFAFEVVARPIDGADSGFYDYGLVYRAQDDAHYYVFVVGADGYYAIMRVEDEHYTPLVTYQQFPHVERGLQSNRLLVTCSGPLCTFRINDEYATAVEDDTWLSGDVGLWARSFEEEAVVRFCRARIWAPDGSPQGCSPSGKPSRSR